MTFDSGVVYIFDVTNVNENGEEPQEGLTIFTKHAYETQTVGVQRYYRAIKSDYLIEEVIDIYDFNEGINTNQVAVTEDGKQYIIRQIQKTKDENGIKILRLSLERNGEEYEIID